MLLSRSLILTFLCGCLFGCHSQHSLPPISKEPTNLYTPGRFVWHDLVTPDVAKAKQFYGAVFGWTFETSGSGDTEYTLIKRSGNTIGGIFPIPKDVKVTSGEWVASMSVSDVAKAVNLTTSNGGKVLRGVKDIDGRGKMALVADPQGGILAYMRATGGDPLIKSPEINDWLGMELWTNNPEASKSFYKQVIGYEAEEIKDSSVPFTAFKKDGMIYAALLKNPSKDVRTHWMPYIRVENVSAMVDKAKAAGATIMLTPSPTIRNSTVAIILDPSRAPIVLQEFTPLN
ncbi:VOC family protein [Solitalea canadensis]|uniref:Lactoylglutathione lyase family protein n=1 Tax=Solitalea canadensis (strain ATCC 29591 / DSM 3403 / JCM 21819 / LMG 8368 / NBRC 15130 / NCIMB 12057 / USAM 9D) TaxID=929556 RepID=H8KMK0_SOLCM|nr:VOC family protein [Solitalea canadensis]AFD08991.1 lactoylglutathione lyase family protein [Solitalea canadensis DSM 3403]